jgi:hypothetical protein
VALFIGRRLLFLIDKDGLNAPVSFGAQTLADRLRGAMAGGARRLLATDGERKTHA